AGPPLRPPQRRARRTAAPRARPNESVRGNGDAEFGTGSIMGRRRRLAQDPWGLAGELGLRGATEVPIQPNHHCGAVIRTVLVGDEKSKADTIQRDAAIADARLVVGALNPPQPHRVNSLRGHETEGL